MPAAAPFALQNRTGAGGDMSPGCLGGLAVRWRFTPAPRPTSVSCRTRSGYFTQACHYSLVQANHVLPQPLRSHMRAPQQQAQPRQARTQNGRLGSP